MKRILTVDDSRSMRSIISKALANIGAEILQAEDGKQGLDVVESTPPDLILLDITMPVMDGPAMLKELRARGKKTSVILLTAESGTSVIGPLMQFGFDDYIVKPFQAEELQAKVMKVLNPQPKAMILEQEPIPREMKSSDQASWLPAESRPFVEILIVDDMENVAKQLRSMLPSYLKTNNCLDGQSAATMCRERLYRVILIDLEIPDVDTASLVRQLRALQPSAVFIGLVMRNIKIPIHVARELGLDGAIVKPFDKEQIEDFLTTYFESKDLLGFEDNVLQVAVFNGRKERELRYFSRLNKLINEAIDKLAAACFMQVILDITNAPKSPDPLLKLLTAVARYSADMGIELRLVAPQETHKILKDVVETSGIPFFQTLPEAQGMSAEGANDQGS